MMDGGKDGRRPRLRREIGWSDRARQRVELDQAQLLGELLLDEGDSLRRVSQVIPQRLEDELLGEILQHRHQELATRGASE